MREAGLGGVKKGDVRVLCVVCVCVLVGGYKSRRCESWAVL